MNTTSIGRHAEARAAAYLRRHGYAVLQQNWKTRYCEIDIIAIKAKTIYFAEVKYRSNRSQGSGFDYITAAKQRQISFAAQLWVAQHGWLNPYELMAIEVDGENNIQHISL